MSSLPPLSERTLPVVLSTWAEATPDRVAVSDAMCSLTYSELWDRARSIGAGLRRAIDPSAQRPGSERIALLLDNHVDMACVVAAIGVAGLVEVPVNTSYLGDVLVHQLHDSGAETVIVEAKYVDRVWEVAARLEFVQRIIVRGAGEDAVGGPLPVVLLTDVVDADGWRPEVEPSDALAIMYTSGTTGVSKGVLVSHAHAYTYGAPALLGGAEQDDVEMVVLPLFHVGGQWAGLYNAWIAGAEAYVAERFDGAGFWDEARAHGCTYALLVGAMANFLMQQPERPDDRSNRFRRLFVAPVPEGIEGFAKRFDLEVSTGYGSTEAGTVLVAGAGDARPHGCGFPSPTVEVRLVDDFDRDVRDGQVGELIVRPRESWITMLEYVGRPEATVTAWRNLWYHTGDAMYRDGDGQFVFVDRLGDAIRRRGENIPSAAVEGAINDHPSVLECAVVAVAADMEHEVLAVVVTHPGMNVDPEELLVGLADRLPHFMVPRFVRVVDELERTPSGKVRKRPLREAGLTADTWDREAAGISVTRRGLERRVPHV